MKNNNELVSLLQHGSWYRVAFMVGNHLESFTTQGVKKTREAIAYYGVKHTPGNPYVVTDGIDLKFFLEKSQKSVDKQNSMIYY